MTQPSWLDPALPVADRVEAALGALSTMEVKCLALADYSPLVRLGLPAPSYRDGPAGVRDAAVSTAFPCTLALAATMDSTIAYTYGAAIGAEVRQDGGTFLLGPSVDLVRTPLAGRIPETLGEDPWLAGHLGSAHARGVQSQRVIAMVKHLVGNTFERLRTGDGPVSNRSAAIDAHIDDRTLRETYLVPFREVLVHAGTQAVMLSYNRLDGRYPSENPDLIRLLRDEWQFEGLTAPDFIFAVRDPEEAFRAGLDIPGLDGPSGRTAAMVDAAPIATTLGIARRLVAAMLHVGQADPVQVAEVSAADHHSLAVRVAASSAVLLTNDGILPLAPTDTRIAVIGPAADDAIYTIGGSGGVRPDPMQLVTPLEGLKARASDSKTIRHSQGSHGDHPLTLVPGDVLTQPGNADRGVLAEYFHGDILVHRAIEPTISCSEPPTFVDETWRAVWTTRLTPRRSGRHRFTVTGGGDATLRLAGTVATTGVHEAARFFAGPTNTRHAVAHLTAGVPVDLQVEFATGPALDLPFLGVRPGVELGWQEPDGLIDEAVAVAKSSDVAIVLLQQASGEGMDRTTLALPGDQDDLIRAVASANPRTVVVLNTPGPVLMPWHQDVAAILQVWYPGQAFGDALAAILFGDLDPAGRLPVTFPSSDDDGPLRDPSQYPGVDGVSHHPERGLIGYRHYQAAQRRPLFPFGHGLSYATFHYKQLAITANAGEMVADVTLANEGAHSGTETVQLYVTRPDTTPDHLRELKGVGKISLAPGETGTARVTVPLRHLERWHPECGWHLPGGDWAITVGRSSDDPRLHARYHVDGQRGGAPALDQA